MSLKDEIKWVNSKYVLFRSDADASPLFPMSAVKVIPVEALQAWIESHLKERRYSNTVHNGVIDDLLAELEGLS